VHIISAEIVQLLFLAGKLVPLRRCASRKTMFYDSKITHPSIPSWMLGGVSNFTDENRFLFFLFFSFLVVSLCELVISKENWISPPKDELSSNLM